MVDAGKSAQEIVDALEEAKKKAAESHAKRLENAEKGKSKGYKITGPNGNHIFVPAAGCFIANEIKMVGEYGMYFSYKMCGDYVNFAYGFHFGIDYYELNWLYRAFGRSIRPVTE